MRTAALVPARQQTLCVFCATRLAQRRSFHAPRRNDQQANAAAQPRQQEPGHIAGQSAPSQAVSGTNASGGQGGEWSNDNQPTWSTSTPVIGETTALSAEEQRIRQNLTRDAVRPPIRMTRVPYQTSVNASERHDTRPSTVSDGLAAQQSHWTPDFSADNPPGVPEQWRRTISAVQPPGGQRSYSPAHADQIGPSTGTGSPRPPAFRVTMHDSFRQPPQRTGASRGPHTQWEHLKRRNAQPEPTRQDTQVTGGSPELPGRARAPMDDYTRNSELRRDQTRSGRFIGFESKASIRCYQCGQVGHSKTDCPQLPQRFTIGRMYPPQTTANNQTSQSPPIRSVFLGEQPKYDFSPNTSQAGRPIQDELPQGSPRLQQENALKTHQQQALPEDEGEQDRDRRSRLSRSAKPTETFQESAIKRRDDQRRKNRNIQYAREAAMLRDDEEERAERRRAKDLRKAERLSNAQQVKQVAIPPFISIGHLATLLSVRASQFERSLKRLGFTNVSHDHVLNAEDASLIAQEYDFAPVLESSQRDDDLRPAPEPEDKSSLPPRPPVVTIMGHVDHGKTTILDYLRKSSIAASEHGGITQHIGAFSVPMASGRTITFLDTPGHAAFLTMRQRGANVTDIVILVVAADDSVMPQTLESIRCAKTAGVPMIVAINKMDKKDAEPERVKQDLARHGVELEDFGGDTQVVHVSGQTGLGMEDLEEAISTLSEILDQRADPSGVVEGWILEASTRKSGRVATILVRRGTLEVGDIIVAGTTWARVRTMRNEFGALVDSVGPGMPVEIDGWRDQPSAGDEVLQAIDERQAADVTDHRNTLVEQVKAAKDMNAINLARRLEAERREVEASADEPNDNGEIGTIPTVTEQETSKSSQEVHFVVKGDVSGSVEAVINQVSAIGNAEIRPVILHSAVGPINQGDVDRASLANGYIIAFNTAAEPGVHGQAERAGVGLIEQSIIYRVTDEVKALLESRLPPEVITKVTGEAEVAQPFSINLEKRKFVRIAGSKVRNGTISVRSKAKVLRGGEVIHTGLISSLRNKKQDAQEMRKGTECGISFDGWEGFEIGDQIQCFEEVEKRRTL